MTTKKNSGANKVEKVETTEAAATMRPARAGEHALKVLVNGAPAAVSPWSASEAVEIGIQQDGAFTPLENMVILVMAEDFRRRFERLERREYCDAVYAVRLIMYRRLKNHFPDCRISMQIIQPRGDIGVAIDNCPVPYVNDRHVLQERLDDACARLAECLGI